LTGVDPISLNVIADLIRRLNDALGTTSIIVTYDVSESPKVVDYLYVIARRHGRRRRHARGNVGPADPVLHQFLHAAPCGPMGFRHPEQPIRERLRQG
jgi:phospholipid/cholesterol/gamma-HCH transport system ATP-binding protein